MLKSLKNNELLIVLALVIIAFGGGYAFKANQENAAPVLVKSSESKKESSEKKSVKKNFRPDGSISSVVSIEEVAKSDSKLDQKFAQVLDNGMVGSDLKDRVVVLFRPVDSIPILNKLWIGLSYNKNHNEVRAESALSFRLF